MRNMAMLLVMPEIAKMRGKVRTFLSVVQIFFECRGNFNNRTPAIPNSALTKPVTGTAMNRKLNNAAKGRFYSQIICHSLIPCLLFGPI